MVVGSLPAAALWPWSSGALAAPWPFVRKPDLAKPLRSHCRLRRRCRLGETTACRCKIRKMNSPILPSGSCHFRPKACVLKITHCDIRQSSRGRKHVRSNMLGATCWEPGHTSRTRSNMLGVGAACQDMAPHVKIRCNMSGLGLHVGKRRNAKIILKSDSNDIKSDE